jgi:hypothetical protein
VIQVTSKQIYVPGVCNIGPQEIGRRRNVGYGGLVLALVTLAVLWAVKAPAVTRLIVFFPASMAASGFLQAGMHFCAGFGMAGVFNFGQKVGATEDVVQAEYRIKDRRKAIQILTYSVLIGLVIAVIAVRAL